MGGAEKKNVHNRESLKAQSSFNNYPKWKQKVTIILWCVSWTFYVYMLGNYWNNVKSACSSEKIVTQGYRRIEPACSGNWDQLRPKTTRLFRKLRSTFFKCFFKVELLCSVLTLSILWDLMYSVWFPPSAFSSLAAQFWNYVCFFWL